MCWKAHGMRCGVQHIFSRKTHLTAAGGNRLWWPKWSLPKWTSQGPLPSSSRADATPLAYSSRSYTNPGLKHIHPSAFLHSSMKRHMTSVSAFSRNNKRNPSSCTFSLNARSFFTALSRLPFCKTGGLITAFKWSKALHYKVVHSTLNQH